MQLVVRYLTKTAIKLPSAGGNTRNSDVHGCRIFVFFRMDYYSYTCRWWKNNQISCGRRDKSDSTAITVDSLIVNTAFYTTKTIKPLLARSFIGHPVQYKQVSDEAEFAGQYIV